MPTKHNYTIHISGVQQFKECRQAWAWASPLRANLTPIEKYVPFFTGSLIHHCREHLAQGATNVGALIEQWIEANTNAAQRSDPKLLDAVALVRGMLYHYDLWQKYDTTWLADAQFEFVATEQQFKIPLWANSRSRVWLAGIFDGVVRSKHNGKLYLWELKTTRSVIEREKQLDLDAQTDAYANAARKELGLDIAGIVYTLMRKKIPEVKMLKTGMLSQAKDQDVTAEWYLDAIKRAHPDQAHAKDLFKAFASAQYGDILNTLVQENKYFRRVVINRSHKELDDGWQQLQSVAQEMVNPKIPIYRNEGNHCNWCLWRIPCIAKRQGRDIAPILSSGYEYNARYAAEIED